MMEYIEASFLIVVDKFDDVFDAVHTNTPLGKDRMRINCIQPRKRW